MAVALDLRRKPVGLRMRPDQEEKGVRVLGRRRSCVVVAQRNRLQPTLTAAAVNLRPEPDVDVRQRVELAHRYWDIVAESEEPRTTR